MLSSKIGDDFGPNERLMGFSTINSSTLPSSIPYVMSENDS